MAWNSLSGTRAQNDGARGKQTEADKIAQATAEADAYREWVQSQDRSSSSSTQATAPAAQPAAQPAQPATGAGAGTTGTGGTGGASMGATGSAAWSASRPGGGASTPQPSLGSVAAPEMPRVDYESIYNEARRQKEGAAASARDALLESLQKQYDVSRGNITRAADEAQRQNYIASQMQRRNIGQELAATGRNGGAAESTLLGLANAYGENRRATETGRIEQLGGLEESYGQQRANAESAYNERMADIAGSWAEQLAAARQAQADREAEWLAQQYAVDQQRAIAEYEAQMDAWRDAQQAAQQESSANFETLMGIAYDGRMPADELRQHEGEIVAEYGRDAYNRLLLAAMENSTAAPAAPSTAAAAGGTARGKGPDALTMQKTQSRWNVAQ